MRVYSIYKSINGECSRQLQGSLCTIIRFSQCNLSCRWCDSSYAQLREAGVEIAISEIIRKVKMLGCRNVVLTGGEPLLQKDLPELTKFLDREGFNVSVETNGSLHIPWEIPVNSWVVDWKCSSSGMQDYMNVENFVSLTGDDFIKFVIADRVDFIDALNAIDLLRKLYEEEDHTPRFAFSPVDQSKSVELIEWMKDNKLLCEIGAIFSLQIHKVIWKDSCTEV